MIKIGIHEIAGDFAENKDLAKKLRTEKIMPAIKAGESLVIDFSRVSLSTQSFIHALISDAMRKHGMEVLDLISFKGCNPAVKALISTVCDYMQDTGHDTITDVASSKPKKRLTRR